MLSCNVRGLCSFEKRSSIVNHFLHAKGSHPIPDIFSFQETHSTPEVARKWKCNFGQKTIFSHGTGRARGVLLGFSDRLEMDIVESDSDQEGRYIVANVNIKNEKLMVVAVYLEPNASEDLISQVYEKIDKSVSRYQNTRVVYCGDFNSILDRKLDTTIQWSKRSDTLLSQYMEANELTDVWRVLHPEECRFSSFTRGLLSRIDLFLASPAMLTYITDSYIGNAYKSDHSPIYLHFSLQEEDRGRGNWRLPTFLLGCGEYRQVISELIKELVELNQDADPATLWDTIKACIRGESIRFLAKEKRRKKAQIEDLEAEIAQATQDRDSSKGEDWTKHYANKVAFLQIELDDVYIAGMLKLKLSIQPESTFSQVDHLNIILVCREGNMITSRDFVANLVGWLLNPQKCCRSVVSFMKSYTLDQHIHVLRIQYCVKIS